MSKGLMIKILALVLVVACFSVLLCMDRIIDGNKKDDTDHDTYQPTGLVAYNGENYRLRSDVRTILFIGNAPSDAIPAEDRRNATEAQFLTLLVLDDTAKTYTVIEIAPSTYTTVFAGKTSVEDCISMAHSYGVKGKVAPISMTQSAVQRLLNGIRVEGSVDMPLTSVSALVDELGDVEITPIEGDQHVDASLVPGTAVKIKGALAYRYLEKPTAGEGQDETALLARRVNFMQAFYREVKKITSNYEKLSALLSKAEGLDYFGMTFTDLYGVFKSMQDYRYAGSYVPEGTYATESGKNIFRVNEEQLKQYVVKTFCETR